MSNIEVRFAGYQFSSARGEIWLDPYPNIVTSVSPISSSLEATAFSVRVLTRAFGVAGVFTSLMEAYSTDAAEDYVIDDGDILGISYGEPLEFYEDGVRRAIYFITSVEREGREKALIKATSAVGLLLGKAHRGGIYAGTKAGEIIDEILGDADYSINGDVYDTLIYGWLPATNTSGSSARDNLQQVLFAVGACLTEDSMGQISISFPSNAHSENIPAARIFLTGAPNVRKNKLSKIRLIEHSYFMSEHAAEVVIYDNTDGSYVTDYDVYFDAPYASYRGVGLTVDPVEHGANWARITGVGVLYGVPYVHMQREINLDTGVSGGAELDIKDATLVSALNSANVLTRISNMYNGTVSQAMDVVMGPERSGDFVTYKDAFGDDRNGFIMGVDATISSYRRGALSILTGWTPKGVGNTYNSYFLVRTASNGTITIPAAHRGKKALAVLFGGAQGGSGGYDGERGTYGRPYSSTTTSRGFGGDGGEGGAPGEGGGAGKYLIVDIDSLGASYPGSIGAGGAGGARNGELGQMGGDTVLGDWTSGSGILLAAPYINMIDGSIYGESGGPGYSGKRGGKGGDLPVTGKKGEDGEAGEDFNTLWHGGAGGLGCRYGGQVESSGGGGGGAAYGANGHDGGTATDAQNWGAPGADAIAPAQAEFYRGGTGGNGGGGGGGSHYASTGYGATYNHPGAGGLGSVGGQGANGFILFYV